MEFRVIRYGAAESTGTLPDAVAQGKYVMVELEVSNIANEPQSFAAGNQTLFIGEKVYEADSTAAAYLDSLNIPINPGNQIRATIAFDVAPEVDSVDGLRLKDSILSRGTLVRLG